MLLFLGVVMGAGVAAVRYLGWPPALQALLAGVSRRLESAEPTSRSPATEAVPEKPRPTAKPHVQKPAAEASVVPSEVSGAKGRAPAAPPSAQEAAQDLKNAPGSSVSPQPKVADAPSPGSQAPAPPSSPAAATPPRAHGEREPRSTTRRSGNSVFEESARRVRSLQGLEQFPPGTIQLTPSTEVPPGPPSAPTP